MGAGRVMCDAPSQPLCIVRIGVLFGITKLLLSLLRNVQLDTLV